jgi:NAD(P)-dependent dehydrogenase (short-subunit alcohol dehydrogenase family)
MCRRKPPRVDGEPARLPVETKEAAPTAPRKEKTMTTASPTIQGSRAERLLEGKVTIVTGASRGIGAAAARAFANAGAAVVLAARDQQALAAAAAEIGRAGGQATAVATDVTDPDAVERLVATTVERFGRLDGAFNNAGHGHLPTPLAELDPTEFTRVLDVNLVGVFLCLRAELPRLTAGGAIVNMSSSAGLSGAPGMSAYSAAKHGVIGLTRTAALDYGPKGVRVNAMAPGPILTEDGIGAAPAEIRQRVAQALPLRRLGTPNEVAELGAWLLSDAASFVNGATISIDGGKLAGMA